MLYEETDIKVYTRYFNETDPLNFEVIEYCKKNLQKNRYTFKNQDLMTC